VERHRPSECVHCGCSEVARDGYLIDGQRLVSFRCGTLWTHEDGGGKWLQDKIGCNGHIGDLYRRIRRALRMIKTAERHEFVDGYSPRMRRCGDGDFVEFDDVDKVIQILEGKSDETD